MSKHTPGQWKATAKPNDACCWSFHVETVERLTIAGEVLEDSAMHDVADVRTEADAHLLAAAPELLAALKRFAEIDHPCSDRLDCIHCNALDAIAKAEGEQTRIPSQPEEGQPSREARSQPRA